ncbi:MAG: 5'/3'-nucleotidase SurE [Actinomycetota bacterium]|jgi:5'-nucleotidase|nr:5'/3'-nucleotidase SurE [Acidimicrobiales bacterium]MEC7874899.1 5'/3'-nucleotidase SurE [Actinomycetota bacterium]MEC8827454.1 5'/3'-nucleotidase SurE [Actinomycetota bacterium]MEC8923741.1 5'/3'-nucleotidase SurE [Actinomycetota bacterium]MEC8977063.1 5'/3'-nucleotidase SurE [Actinomycetota bacterium]|tara:strand:+ start:340 stop:1107 length:768 start_codon:yes stop_codon:yes gene_type:complete
MRVLITNDDGVASDGLWALARRVIEAGYEVVVVAPKSDMTGMGGAIGGDLQDGELRAEKIEREDLGATECWMIDGPPALCVVMTQLGAFGDPVPLVVSGVNPGLNCGRSALHSGTVGAALTAANNGAHGLAVSLDATDAVMQWPTAVHLVPELIERLKVIQKGRRVINLNAPNLSLTEVEGVQITGLAKWGDAAGRLTSKGEGLWSFERQPGDPNRRIDGTDNAAVREGFISVSELVGIRTQTSDLDLGAMSLSD